MAMGKRREVRQETLFVATDRLPKSAGHPFYQRLNALLTEAGFDAWIEGRCRQYYEMDETRGRPSGWLARTDFCSAGSFWRWREASARPIGSAWPRR